LDCSAHFEKAEGSNRSVTQKVKMEVQSSKSKVQNTTRCEHD